VSRVLVLDGLTSGELDEWACLLREEAARRRRAMTAEQAWVAFNAAPLTPGWQRSRLADVGRVRIATRRLITIDRWRPDQITEAMKTLAIFVCPDPVIGEMAVAGGIQDAMEILGEDEPS
jgi:hypothetical protein